MFDSYEESDEYKEMRERVIELITNAPTALTHREIKTILGTDRFLWDIMQSLLFADIVEDVGGVMVSKFKFKQPIEAIKQKTQVCKDCGEEKSLVAFYQEWSGKPSSSCKDCKIRRVTKRKNTVVKG